MNRSGLWLAASIVPVSALALVLADLPIVAVLLMIW
jgi:hypothetical protein